MVRKLAPGSRRCVLASRLLKFFCPLEYVSLTREIEIGPGLRCWTSGLCWCPLPAGLADRSEGVVIRQDGVDVVVEINGRLWVLRPWQVDCGEEYQTPDGAWVREPNPLIMLHVKGRLAECLELRRLRLAHDNFPETNNLDFWIDKYEWVLARNGWF